MGVIPLRDDIPTRHVPIVNYLLIAANILVFALQWLAGSNQEALVYQFALIPAQLTTGVSRADIADIFTSMFMHGGFLHLAGNMLYLWIFGDNVEDRMGSVQYLVFYLVGGVMAALAHTLTNPGSQIPTVGASGAIAAVLGAYLVLYPRSRVLTFIPLGFFMRITLIPASIVLSFWFLLQILYGVLTLGASDVGGVAFWAHIGGFVYGVLVGLWLANHRRVAEALRW
jgi:membrane associated rhomboid family serine protease